MSAPTPARLKALPGGRDTFTVRKARRILEHPIFGDERCIEARALLVLAERVRRAREAFWPEDDLPKLHLMTEAQLKHELAVRKSCGWEEDEEEPTP